MDRAASDDETIGVRIIAGPPTTAGRGSMRPELGRRVPIDDDDAARPRRTSKANSATAAAPPCCRVGGEQRSTVFIDDRGPGTGEIVTIDVATSAARMEPRMRERRIAVKRAVGRKRLKWVADRMRRRRRRRRRAWPCSAPDCSRSARSRSKGAVYSQGDVARRRRRRTRGRQRAARRHHRGGATTRGDPVGRRRAA